MTPSRGADLSLRLWNLGPCLRPPHTTTHLAPPAGPTSLVPPPLLRLTTPPSPNPSAYSLNLSPATFPSDRLGAQAISPIITCHFGERVCVCVWGCPLSSCLGLCVPPAQAICCPLCPSLPACWSASPALCSGGPLPAAPTSLARMQWPWPHSGTGGCWQKLCSRQEAEEGGLGGWGQTGLRSHRHKDPSKDVTPPAAFL